MPKPFVVELDRSPKVILTTARMVIAVCSPAHVRNVARLTLLTKNPN